MPSNIKKYIFVFVAIILLAYTCIRAYRISFSIDEAFSFMYYALDSYRNIILFKLLDPNNHVLNTVLMKFFSSWLPLAEITLRIPSLLAHLLYIMFTWLLLRDFKNSWLKMATWLLLNLNPFMLDFFSCARGYALSWAMMVGSLYFLKQALEAEHKKGLSVFLCFAFGALAVLGSFPLVNYYLALLIIFGSIAGYRLIFKWQVTKNKKWFLTYIILITSMSVGLLVYTISITYKLQHAGFLYFGGIIGFWQDTVCTVIDKSLYGVIYPAAIIFALKILVILVPIIAVFFLGLKIIVHKKPTEEYYFLMVLLALLILIVGGILSAHIFLDVRVVIERAAIFILIIYLLILVQLLHHVSTLKFTIPLSLLMSAIVLCHFIYTANTFYFYEWKSDNSTKQMMQDMNKWHNEQGIGNKKPIVFQPEWLFVVSSMFYQYLYHYTWMEPIEAVKEFSFAEDYYYFPQNGLNELNGQSVAVIKEYPLAQTLLLKNKSKKETIYFAQKAINLYDTISTDTAFRKFLQITVVQNIKSAEVKKGIFSPELKFDVSSISGKTNVTVKALAKVFFPKEKSGEFIILIQDKNGKILKWNSLGFDRYLLQKDGWMEIPFKIIIDKMDANAAQIKVYIWNTGQNSIIVSDIGSEILFNK